MSRYLGPRVKKMRALGLDIPGLSRKSIERRPYPPGQHGPNPRRKKESAFKVRLQEKQKVRLYYGLTERQFGNVVAKATAGKGNTGEQLLALLESRLDNVVFRAGFARTIPAARQLVRHGHLLVNGKKVDVPGYRVRARDIITLRERSKELDVIATSLAEPVSTAPTWMSIDKDAKSVLIAGSPDSTSVLISIDTRLIVEFYAQ
jgi:small subunit ribosomal protein S4